MKIQNQYDPKLRKYIELKKTTALIPVGSLEQHGMHLPISTDSEIVSEIAKRISEKYEFLLLPLLTYGCSSEHSPYFNVSLKNKTLLNVLYDICLSLYKNNIKRIIILNGHYGNKRVMHKLKPKINKIQQNVDIQILSYWEFIKEKFDHAGFVETSLMLVVSNKVIMHYARKGKLIDNLSTAEKIKIRKKMIRSFPSVTKNGVIGDPTQANLKDGNRMMNEVMKNLEEYLDNTK